VIDWHEYKRTVSRRAVWVGATGTMREPCQIVTVSKDGVRVKWADGRIERVHPGDLRPA